MTGNVGEINLIRRMHTIHVVEQGWPPGKVKDPSNIKESHYLLSFVEEGFIEVEISHRFFASSYIQDNSKTSSTGAVPLLPAMFGLGSQQLAGSLVHWKVLSEQRCLFTLWSSITIWIFSLFPTNENAEFQHRKSYPANGNFGVYGIDCEMCYTVAGLELTKVNN